MLPFRAATRHHTGLRSLSHYVKMRLAIHPIQRKRGKQTNQMQPGTAITRNKAEKVSCDLFVRDFHLYHVAAYQHGKHVSERDIDATARSHKHLCTIGQRYHLGLNLKVYSVSP
jgi:hypothetical protein